MAGCKVLIHAAFTLLPALTPEPRLVRRDRKLRMQFDHPIIPLDDLNLSAGVVKLVATPHPRGQYQLPAALNRIPESCPSWTA